MEFAGKFAPGDLEETKRLIIAEWLERILETYPEKNSRLLRLETDPFRNPAGHAFREGAGVLVEEVLGGMVLARITPALDAIVRIRAVQDFTPTEAVAFVFLLRDVAARHLRDRAEILGEVHRRIDHLALEAFDLFMACREKIYEIRAETLKRSMFMQSRLDRKHAVH